MDAMELDKLSVEVTAIADIIANFNDWDTENLEGEFLACVLDSFPRMSPKLLSEIYNSFMSIDSRIRFDAGFDHERFVRRKIREWGALLP